MNFFTQLKTARASFPLFLFALTFSLTLSSCKKDPTPITTTITGKVVTFREDSLYYDGPIDVALYSSSMDWPIEKLETKPSTLHTTLNSLRILQILLTKNLCWM